ncbi:hypothetical protein ASPWEDRAFT_23360 [Aspergillus wentii DTO 134E9]|uniref:F-box domain-containing protein n=1 Tax=Aspergillus wentii DTO 134E9 TaxID=1073089 RepID=A0A1L9S259_ASPWE|nr:uncharacterized protein ASPWEDRAFT_23360 [Aspergillus wentii DTO 134E9]KAI9924026.1 hypothetical protein MW887_007484 [Aspergillus wentii]OJJ41254.1 hypothetical protein ASPWEDRAFT_23360 [Aspergillus wentii DTO 134E9]
MNRQLLTDEASNPFARLPTEVIQYIAYLLPSDDDVAKFSSACTFLAAKVLPSESSIWRGRFGDKYDIPRGRCSTDLKIEYQIRAIVLSQKISFKYGEKEEQMIWLEVIRDMLLESGICENEQLSSKTFKKIREVLSGADFLNRPVSGYGRKEPRSPSDLFCAVQLCLTDLALDPSMVFRCLRTDYDIRIVYSYHADIIESLVSIEKLNMANILHIRNFWLRHFLNPDEATFCDSFTKLPECHRPKTRKNLAEKSTKLTCIHPYPGTLSCLETRQTCADLDSHWTQVEPMSLQIKINQDPQNWPPLFDSIISIRSADSNRTYFRGIQKTYGIDDEPANLVRGFTEPIPEPQGGFPGWTRICFAIYDADREQLPLIVNEGNDQENDTPWLPDEEWPPFDLAFEFNWIHGYEGVLLPGGRIMMGRWIDMIETTARGPFIFWDL